MFLSSLICTNMCTNSISNLWMSVKFYQKKVVTYSVIWFVHTRTYHEELFLYTVDP